MMDKYRGYPPLPLWDFDSVWNLSCMRPSQSRIDANRNIRLGCERTSCALGFGDIRVGGRL